MHPQTWEDRPGCQICTGYIAITPATLRALGPAPAISLHAPAGFGLQAEAPMRLCGALGWHKALGGSLSLQYKAIAAKHGLTTTASRPRLQLNADIYGNPIHACFPPGSDSGPARTCANQIKFSDEIAGMSTSCTYGEAGKHSIFATCACIYCLEVYFQGMPYALAVKKKCNRQIVRKHSAAWTRAYLCL